MWAQLVLLCLALGLVHTFPTLYESCEVPETNPMTGDLLDGNISVEMVDGDDNLVTSYVSGETYVVSLLLCRTLASVVELSLFMIFLFRFFYCLLLIHELSLCGVWRTRYLLTFSYQQGNSRGLFFVSNGTFNDVGSTYRMRCDSQKVQTLGK
mgnify:CR=1 FL=1